MNIEDLTSFVYVASTENITTAAKFLNITESGLSKAIRRIEKELGYNLFKREHNRLHLTEEGLRALKISELIINLRKELNVQNSILTRTAAQKLNNHIFEIISLENPLYIPIWIYESKSYHNM